MPDQNEARGHVFGPIEDVGLFAGVTSRQVTAIGVLVGLSFFALLALPAIIGLPMGLVLLALGLMLVTVRFGGRPAVDWTDLAVRHWIRKLVGGNDYRAAGPDIGHFRTLGVGDDVTADISLPEDLQDIEFLGVTYQGQLAGVIHDAREKTYCATLQVGADGFQLLDIGEQQQREAAWAEVLGGLCRDNSPIGRIQWLERTLPAQQDELFAYLRERRDPAVDADAPALKSYLALLEQAGEVQQQHQLFLTLRLDATKRYARKNAPKLGPGHEGYCALLMRELDSLAKALSRSRVIVQGVLRPRQLAEIVQLTYDPFGSRTEGGDPAFAGVDPSAAGPMRAETRWDTYRADGALHRTFYIAEWPKVSVGADFLSPLLIGATATRSIAVTIEPVPTDKALADAERAATSEASDEEMRQRRKFRTSMKRRRMQQGIIDREAELASGFSEVRFAGFITVSGRSEPELDEYQAEVEHLAMQSRIGIRPMDGEHGEALTYTMPLARGLRQRVF